MNRFEELMENGFHKDVEAVAVALGKIDSCIIPRLKEEIREAAIHSRDGLITINDPSGYYPPASAELMEGDDKDIVRKLIRLQFTPLHYLNHEAGTNDLQGLCDLIRTVVDRESEKYQGEKNTPYYGNVFYDTTIDSLNIYFNALCGFEVVHKSVLDEIFIWHEINGHQFPSLETRVHQLCGESVRLPYGYGMSKITMIGLKDLSEILPTREFIRFVRASSTIYFTCRHPEYVTVWDFTPLVQKIKNNPFMYLNYIRRWKEEWLDGENSYFSSCSNSKTRNVITVYDIY